jgi:hypothetical protein
MPPFPNSVDEVTSSMAPYFREGRLIDFFFEMLVVEIVGRLPLATSAAIRELKSELPDVFANPEDDWKHWVRNACNLSDTFDVAVLDLWIRNSANAQRDGWTLEPWHFAKIFGENYFVDGSQIDIWHGDALEHAKQRIAAYRATH